MRILVVEDEKKMASFVKRGLMEAGYAVDHAESGMAAETLVGENRYDLVILDLMLPDQNGLDTARHMRRDGYDGPILMLTALSGTKDKVRGLDSGADDYLTKPFAFEELLARVRALFRRKGNEGMPSVLRFSSIEINLLNREVKRESRKLSLTPKEFTLLQFFLQHPERPITRTELAEHVWDIHFDPESNVIDVTINVLRKKLEEGGETRVIHTLVGVGYELR